MLSKKTTRYDFREMVPKSSLTFSGGTVYYHNEISDGASVSRLVKFMVPQTSFSEKFETNPFHFQQLDLEALRLNCEGSLVGVTPSNLNENLVCSYYHSFKALGFQFGGSDKTLDNFENNICLVFKLTAHYHIEDNTLPPELTGARLGLELKFSKAITDPERLILLGERMSTELIDRKREKIKFSSI